ncbi:hypothetical protein DFP94_11724 [Fontibacillus phaseoli]|uniref:Uncharacterized protein n=1 Tax=Fontibacillus phaseoli TaxID=1416533 RepID=A0A369B1V3_9BACL|nr:hypothetical protein DFP94_11724 [Fontibacillus phaseoli]
MFTILHPALHLTEGWVTGKLLHGLMIQTNKYVFIQKCPDLFGCHFFVFLCPFRYVFLQNGLRYIDLKSPEIRIA